MSCKGINKDGSKCLKGKRYVIYGIYDGEREYCSVHVKNTKNKDEMYNLTKPFCIHKDEKGKCKNYATRGDRYIMKRIYCRFHQKDGMVNLQDKMCRWKGIIDGKEERCWTCPSYGFDKPDYCLEHKSKKMIYLKVTPFCDRCTKKWKKNKKLKRTRASFGFPDDDKPSRCKRHMKKNMEDIISPRCRNEKCKKIFPAFNYENQKKGMFCFEHKTDEMVNVTKKKCLHKKCIKGVSYGFKKNGKKLYCAEHALDGMCDLTKKECKHKKCSTGASFNFLGENEPLYCSKHAKDNMINLYKFTCQYFSCNTWASYGKNGKRQYCSRHKDDDMKIVGGDFCQEKGCYKMASYGLKKKKLYCAPHGKKYGMKNIKSKKCDICKKIVATFNYPSCKTGLRCTKCATENMIDVTAIRCDQENCFTTAGFAIPGNKQNRCATHKEEGMIVNPRKRCVKDGCKKIALYGFKDKIMQLHCEDHIVDKKKEINYIEKICKGCKLITIVNKEGKCRYCNGSFGKGRLIKQLNVKKMFDRNNIEYQWYDNIIDPKCGRERPDFVFVYDDRVIIVEVDENQHRSKSNYKKIDSSDIEMKYLKRDDKQYFSCEEIRMINISQMFGGKKVVFIRFNPDSYRVNGKKIITNENRRYRKLLRIFKKFRNKNIDELDFLSAIYLYYDEFDSKNVQLFTLMNIENK